MSMEVSFGDTGQAIMAVARSETPGLSQASVIEMVFVQSSSFLVVYFPVSVDDVYSVTSRLHCCSF